MSEFYFAAEDILSEGAFSDAFVLHGKNRTAKGAAPLKTTGSGSGAKVGITSASLSDILQGTAAIRPTAFTMDGYNQSLSSDLGQLIASEGGAGEILGGRSSLLAYDIMLKGGYDDGKFTGASGIAGVVADALGTNGQAPAPVGNRTGTIGEGQTPQSMGLENGRIDTSYLVHIGVDPGGEQLYLWEPAANSYLALRQQAEAEGIDLTLYEAYRTIERQQYFWDEMQAGRGATAAPVGTSNHGWGLAIDVVACEYGSAKHNWLKANAIPQGWTNNVSGEPWHWAFQTSG